MNQMWDDALVYIQEKVPKQVYETWFTPVVLDRVEDTTAYLAVPNKFFGEWLGEHYHDLLAEAVSAAQGGGRMDVSFVINNKQAPRCAAGAFLCGDGWARLRGVSIKARRAAQSQVYVQEFRRWGRKSIRPCGLYGGG